jgi:nitrite reductase/ring-hydroxylating ferredoxin subunit
MALSEIEPRETKVIPHRGQMVMLVLLPGGDMRAYDARCPHANTVIPSTKLRDDLRVECPMHGATFAAKDGSRLDGPTCGDLVSWPVRVVDGYVEVDVPERVISTDWRPGSWGTVGKANRGTP